MAKRLFIRLGFMGKLESWLEDYGLKRIEGPLEAELLCFGRDMRRFGEALVAKDAGYFELFKDRKYPLGSFMSAIYFKLERRFLDRMIAAVPEPAEVLSFEHDGLGIKLNGLSETALLEALNFNPMVKVAIKAPHDPLELAREQFPGEEWVGPTAVSGLQFGAAELHRALLVTRRCMQPMKPQKQGEPELPSATDNAVDFGKVLAAHLEGDVLVPEGDNVFLQYLPDKGRWEAQKICDKGLHGFARQYSHIFEPVHCCWVDGVLQKRPRGDRLRPHVEVSYPLDLPAMPRAQAGRPAAHQPPGSLRGWLGLRLPRRQLLPCQAQRFLQAQPALEALPPRLVGERGGPQSREGVDGAAQEEPQGLDRGGLASDRGDAGHAEEGRQAGAGALGQALRLRPLLEVAECLQRGHRQGHHVGKNFARALAGHPAFCELIWNCGPAQSGKNLGVAILQALAGTGLRGRLLRDAQVELLHEGRQHQYCMEACSPFLSATEGARFVFVSEVSNRRISIALLKPLCE